MSNIQETFKTEIEEMYGDNAPFILHDRRVISEVESAERFAQKNDTKMVNFCIDDARKKAKEFHENRLSPATVKVGDGVTFHLYSDAHACTVIKVTKCTVTVQQDTATIDPNFKPEFIAGGFAGHCTNQNEQTYTYERNPNGAVSTYRWSNKYNRYQGGGDGSIVLTKGRREFYDYNF